MRLDVRRVMWRGETSGRGHAESRFGILLADIMVRGEAEGWRVWQIVSVRANLAAGLYELKQYLESTLFITGC